MIFVTAFQNILYFSRSPHRIAAARAPGVGVCGTLSDIILALSKKKIRRSFEEIAPSWRSGGVMPSRLLEEGRAAAAGFSPEVVATYRGSMAAEEAYTA